MLVAKRRGIEDRIDAVLRGQERVTVEVLVELIDTVNPTGRDVSAADRRERYRQKGRLQSVLLREHGEIVHVERVDERTIALRLDGTGRHAAHARIDGLDDDARSLVQRRLDTPSDAPAAVVGGRPRPNVARLPEPALLDDLAAGDAAMASYDYEAALIHYTRAADNMPSADSEARLLGLLVDVLVDDAAVLARASRISDDRRGATVRALIATAEARSGSLANARALIVTVDAAIAAGAWVEIGARALREGDLEAASEGARRARALDPTSAALGGLERDLAQRASQGVAIAESELASFIATGASDDDVFERARLILARHPTSRSAAAEKRRIEQARAARDADEQLRIARLRASTATTPTELAAALAALRAAALEDGELESVSARLDEHRVVGASNALLAELRGTRPRDLTLLAWLASRPAVRTRVRRDACMPPLDWLDELDAPVGGAAAKAAVRAVLDLDRAIELARAEKHAEARELLDAHVILRPLRRAIELRALIADALAVRARERLRAMLDTIGRGDLQSASTAWDAIDHSAFTAVDATDVERVRTALSAHAAREHQLSEFDEALERYDLPRARRLARELVDAGTRDERALQIEATIARRFELVVIEGPCPALDGRDIDPCTEFETISVDDAGHRGMVVSSYGDHAFIRLVALRSDDQPSEVIRSIALRSPFGNIERPGLYARDGVFEMTQRGGTRLRIGWDGTIHEVLAPPRSALGADVLLTTFLLDDQTAWSIGLDPGDANKLFVRVIDTRTGRIRRTVAGEGQFGSFITPHGLAHWSSGKTTCTRVDMDAVPFGKTMSIPPAGKMLAVRPALEDDGFFVLCADREIDFDMPATLRRFGPDGIVRAELRLERAMSLVWSEIAPVVGGCVVRAVSTSAVTRVIAVRDLGSRFEIAWEIDAPTVGLLADSNDIGTWLVIAESPLTMHPLSLDAPPRPRDATPERREEVAPSAQIFVGDHRPPTRILSLAAKLTKELARLSDEALELRVSVGVKSSDLDATWAGAIACASRRPDLAHELFARALELASNRAEVAIDHAQHCILTQRFGDAAAHLDRIVAGGPENWNARRLLAAARYALGDIELARTILRDLLGALPTKAAERVPSTSFATFLDAAYGTGASTSLAGRRARVLQEALRLRDAGDLRGAIALVDVPWIWRPREQTALAILAELWGALEPTTPEEAVRQRLVLAAHHAHDPQRLAPFVLPGRPYRVPTTISPGSTSSRASGLSS